MRTQRFTPEFKQEAVRQIVERGQTVAEVSARTGVSAHSLYKWIKAVAPDKAEKQAGELIGAIHALCAKISPRRAKMFRNDRSRVLEAIFFVGDFVESPGRNRLLGMADKVFLELFS